MLLEAYREGEPPPEHFLNAPELLDGLEHFYNAFWTLCANRSMGYKGIEGGIPWTVMETYARWYQYDEEEAEDLFHHIAHMDRAYLEHQRKKIKSSTPKARR